MKTQIKPTNLQMRIQEFKIVSEKLRESYPNIIIIGFRNKRDISEIRGLNHYVVIQDREYAFDLVKRAEQTTNLGGIIQSGGMIF